jgi:hypothetical protein
VILIGAKASGLDVIDEIRRLHKDEDWNVLPIVPSRDKCREGCD